MTQSELRNLLLDCLALWQIDGRITAEDPGLEIRTMEGVFFVQGAAPDQHPVRWLLQTPPRRLAGRLPRATPSIGALLRALRHALGADQGVALRI